MAANAAEIPIELYDLILSFYTLDENDGNAWDEYQRLNCVAVNREQRGSLRLVCHEWARFFQPTVFKNTITLRNRNDVDALLGLLAKPECHIAEYVAHLECKQSVTIYPIIPWIHALCIKAMPALPRVSKIQRLRIQGPLPPSKTLSSIHGVLPKHLPTSAAGIGRLHLTNLHFKSLGNFVRLIKEVPLLQLMECRNVTWDVMPNEQALKAVSHLHRDTTKHLTYRMTGCTDNTVAAQLLWRLAPTKSTRVCEEDSNALCRITSDIVNIDPAQHVNWTMVAYYMDGVELTLYAEDLKVTYILFYTNRHLSPIVRAYLAAPAPNENIRRIRAMEITFSNGTVRVPTMIGYDWTTIDTQISTMKSLQTFLFVFYSRDYLLLFSREVVALRMPHLRNSSSLKYALAQCTGKIVTSWLWFTHDTIDDELEKGQEVQDCRTLVE